MTKKKRCLFILKKLNELYPNPAPPLNHQDPYTLLIAVLLSAQCTDKRVNEVTPKLFKLAGTPEAMAKQSVEDIQSIIKPCGLSNTKAKAIQALSKVLVLKHHSQVPKDITLLEQLPGVGHKTASVVMSQAFHVPAFPVDTHIHRLAQRWELTSGKNRLQTEKDLKSCFPQKTWSILHLQMIYYARQYCTARSCYGLTCPICKTCFPKRKTKISTHKT